LLVLEEGVGPGLGWVLVAVPPGEQGLVLVLVVLGGQALSSLVNDLLVSEADLHLIGLSLELSEHDVLSSLESVLWHLGDLVGQSKCFVGVESDGLGSLVNDEHGSPVVEVVGDLQNDVFSLLLLRGVDLSSSLHVGNDLEWSVIKLSLDLLCWDSTEFLPVLGWVLVAMPPHEEGLVLVEVVLGGQALLLLVGQSEDFLLAGILEDEVSLVSTLGELSEGNGLAELVGTILVGKGEGSVGVKSDRLGSLVVDEPGSPVVDSFLDLDDVVVSVLLGSHEESSSSLHCHLKVEFLLVLWLLVWLGLLLLVFLGGSGDDGLNSWLGGVSHLLLNSHNHDVEVLHSGLSASLPGEWGVGVDSGVSETESSPLVDLSLDLSVLPDVLLGGLVLEQSHAGW